MDLDNYWFGAFLLFALINSALWLTLRRIHLRRALVWIGRELLLKLHELWFLEALSYRRGCLDLNLFWLTVVYYFDVRLVDS